MKRIIAILMVAGFVVISGCSGGGSSSGGGGGSGSGKYSQSSIDVVDCSSLESQIGASAVAVLNKYNFQKCAVVFGTLIANANAGTIQGFTTESLTREAAVIHAEIIDNNKDKSADSTSVVDALTNGSSGSWINIMSAAGESSEESIVSEMRSILDSEIAIKNSWMQSAGSVGELRGIIAEELIHNWHQYGLAVAYPDKFAVNSDGCVSQESSQGCNYSASALGRLALEAMTVQPIWYRHGANILPDSSGVITGTCSVPNCAAVEFYMNLLVVYRGIKSAASEAPFPSSHDAVKSKLQSTSAGTEMLGIIDDSQYHQLQNGISYSY